MSSAQQPHVAGGGYSGQHGHMTIVDDKPTSLL